MTRHAVWLYYRCALSLRQVEDLLSERGITVSYEAIRCWVIKFGPVTTIGNRLFLRNYLFAGSQSKIVGLN